MTDLDAAPYAAAAWQTLAHTNTTPIWHSQHSTFAAVLAIFPDGMPWYSLLTCIDDTWLLVASALVGWIAFDLQPRGVLLDLTPVDPAVSAGQVQYGAQTCVSPARHGYLCSTFWDVDPPSPQQQLQFQALHVEAAWQPCIEPSYPATAQQFASAYLRYFQQRAEADWWAVDLLSVPDQAARLRLVRAVLHHAQLPADAYALGCLGAGPLEELLSDWLLDELEPEIAHSPNLRHALSTVRRESEPPHIQARLARLLGS